MMLWVTRNFNIFKRRQKSFQSRRYSISPEEHERLLKEINKMEETFKSYKPKEEMKKKKNNPYDVEFSEKSLGRRTWELNMDDILHPSPISYELRGRNSREIAFCNSAALGYPSNSIRILTMASEFDPECFKKALKDVHSLNPALHISLRRTAHNDARFYVPEEVGMNYKHIITDDTLLWMREAEKQMNLPFFLDSPDSLLRVISINTQQDDKTRIIFCFHMAIVDEVSITFIVNDLLELYTKRLNGEPFPSGSVQPSFLNINNSIPMKELDNFWSYRFKNYIKRFKKWDRPKNSLNVPNFQTNTTCMILRIPKERTFEIRQACFQRKVEIHGYVTAVILAAVKDSLEGKAKEDTVNILCQHSLDFRSSFQPRISGRLTGSLVLEFIHDLKISGKDTLWQISKLVDRKIDSYLQSTDIFRSWFYFPIFNRLKFRKDMNRMPSIQITPIGSIDLHNRAKVQFKIDTSELFIMQTNLNRTYNVIVYDIDGFLHVSINFQQPLFDEKTALTFYSNLKSRFLMGKIDVDKVLEEN